MPELTPSTREAARRIGINETVLGKAHGSGRIARKPNSLGTCHAKQACSRRR
jgi:hypothetical protein